jgi:sn-glycerol 3-phosphate transport system substrate-binding protein
VVASYTGGYDDTKLKAQAAAKAGKPPSVVLMSANFNVDLKLSGDVISLEPMLKADETTREDFLKDFWPALHANATVDGELYGVPFHNSTPLLYYNVEHFKEAGLDPAKPPRTWAEMVDAARKLTKGDRSGFMMPAGYDYLGWLMEALSLSNGGRYFNEDYGVDAGCGALRRGPDLQAQGHAAGRHRGGRRVDGLLRRQGLDGAAVDGLAVVHPREHEDAL